MIRLPLFILNVSNIIVETIFVPPLEAVGKVNIESLLNPIQLNSSIHPIQLNSVTPHNYTTEYSYLNITGLARKHGYTVEEYKVTTDDGYILGLHRLSKNNSRNSNRNPVFLMHGLLDSSDSWILQGPNTALGYLLIDEGFDVWLGNARGNKYSAAHTEWNPKQERFWMFSWEEIGTHDLPAMIDLVLKTTDKDSLYYVGHSQGTTNFFVMTALKPEYGNKVKMMFALSPIAWLSNANSPMLKYLSTIPATVLQYFQYFNTIATSNDLLYHIYGSMCEAIATGCGNMFEMLFGTNHYVSDAMLPVIVQHASASSVRQFVHYWQVYRSGRFCRFDYGWMRNLYAYGQFSPPDYDLSLINLPIVLFFSGNDWLSHPNDVAILRSRLPNVYINYYSENFSHIDYLYASVAKEAVYGKIIKHIRDHEQR